ncbi:MAG: class I SAM-dependent methyltransferase [Waterburya sp.]
MASEAKIEFDSERANQYNLDIRKAIPGYEALHSMALSILQVNLNSAAKLLVVGSGTGIELINYSQQNPGWLLTGVDPSPEMMAIAKQELTNQGLMKQVYLHTGYVDTLSATEAMDAATLMLVMHFVPDDGSKLKLLKNIAQRLKPGAELILADLYGDKFSPDFVNLMQAWKAFYFSQLEEEIRVKAEQDFEASINHSIYFITEARIIELLSTAGFSQITKFYNAFLFGGWTAKFTGN